MAKTRFPSLYLLSVMFASCGLFLACDQSDGTNVEQDRTAPPGPTASPSAPTHALPEGDVSLVEAPRRASRSRAVVDTLLSC
jgi:hypothetical protein